MRWASHARRQALTSQINDVERELTATRTEALRLERVRTERQQALASLQQRLDTKQSLDASRAVLEAENARAKADLEVRRRKPAHAFCVTARGRGPNAVGRRCVLWRGASFDFPRRSRSSSASSRRKLPTRNGRRRT